MVYIILVNWNGWRDTIECLESLFKLTYSAFTVIICDNASEDGSIDQIMCWSQGGLVAEAADPLYNCYLNPPHPKPIWCAAWHPGLNWVESSHPRILLIPCHRNLGFAGGSNVGIRFALDQADVEFVWLLNNDTVVQPDALVRLIEKMRSEPNIGICGSLLRYYAEPEIVQCFAGFGFNYWTARVLQIRVADSAGRMPTESEIEPQLKYISGASMFLSKTFLENIGLMNEQYFLYFEEIDWATRARGKYSLGYCHDSVIYHKEGRAIGSSRKNEQRSLLSESYLSRNRIIFTRTYLPWRTAVVMLWVTLVSAQRMLRGNYSSGLVMLKSAWSGLFRPLNRPSRPA